MVDGGEACVTDNFTKLDQRVGHDIKFPANFVICRPFPSQKPSDVGLSSPQC